MSTVPKRFDLPRWLMEVASIESEVNDIASTLTESQFHAPPRLGGWSVGYCLEHLVLTGEASLAAWDMALEQAPLRTDSSSDRYHWWGRAILSIVEPPYRMKLKAPQSLLPCSRRSIEATVFRFQSMHQEFTKRAGSWRGMDLTPVWARSPLAPYLLHPLDYSFDLALAHERRHVWQACQVRRLMAPQ